MNRKQSLSYKLRSTARVSSFSMSIVKDDVKISLDITITEQN